MVTDELLPLDAIRSQNPWYELSLAAPFILNADRTLVEQHNQRCKSNDHLIVSDILPEPFIGSPRAPIWLLNLNPGFHPEDRNVSDAHKSLQRLNLELAGDRFWYLRSDGTSPGHRWWQKYLGGLVKSNGREWCEVNLFCVELFPYHSVRYKRGPLLPSQAFTRKVVEWGCAAQKRFIVMRQLKGWIELVPALAGAKMSQLKNKQNVWITPNNMTHPEIISSA
jgi:hypothetical protein